MDDHRDPVCFVAAWFFWQEGISNFSTDWRLDPHTSTDHPHPDHLESGRGDIAEPGTMKKPYSQGNRDHLSKSSKDLKGVKTGEVCFF